MKTYTYEATYTVSTVVEVEAENEEKAQEEALNEVADMPIGDLKEWSSEAELQKVTERCDYCYQQFDVDIEPLVDYDGGRYCPDCKDELEHADD